MQLEPKLVYGLTGRRPSRLQPPFLHSLEALSSATH